MNSSRMACKIHVLAANAVLLLLVCLTASSQGLQLGHITGVVTDQQGGVIAGATVNVIDLDRGVTRPLTTDAAGLYSAPGLTAGTYTVHVEAPGFKALDRQNVVLGNGEELRVDVTLQPGAQNQTVTVSEALPIMNTTNTVITSEVTTQQLEDIPVAGRLYTHFLDLQPGILGKPGDNDSSAYSMNGMSGQQNDWLFDGVEDVNQFVDAKPLVGSATSSVNGELTILPLDAVGQVSLISNPSAEYGYQLGAHTNVQLKSGTNALHGTAYAYIRNQYLDANNQFTKVSGSGTLNPRPIDQLEQFGASVGGPIKKDKIFYFGNYEGMRYNIGSPTTANFATSQSLGYNIGGAGVVGVQNIPTNSNTFSLPDAISQLANGQGITPSPLSLALAGCTTTGAAATVLPSKGVTNGNGTLVPTCSATQGVFLNGTTTTTNFPLSNNLQGQSNNQITKIDWHPNDHNAINGEDFFGHSNTDVPLSTLDPNWFQTDLSTTQAVRAVWVYTPNAVWVNEFRFGWDYYRLKNGNGDCAPDGVTSTVNYQALYGFISGSQPNYGSCGFPTVATGANALGASSAAGDQHVLQHTWHIIESVSKTQGKHQFKFGVEVNKTLYNGTGAPSSADGSITFSGNKAFVGSSALEDFLGGIPSTATVLIGDISSDIHLYRYAGYAQDDYRVTRNVTVNLGLRYEYSPPIAEEHNRFGNFSPSAPTGMVQQTNDNALYTTSKRNWGPRLGVSWDVTGKGTTVIRAGGSVVYGGVQLDNIAANGFGAGLDSVPTGFTDVYCNLAIDTTGQPCTSAANGLVTIAPTGKNTEGLLSLANNCAVGFNTSTGAGACSQINWAQNAAVFPTGAGAEYCGDGLAKVTVAGVNVQPAPCALFVLPAHMPTSYVTTWTASIQHAFRGDISLNVAYVGNHGSDLDVEPNINQPSYGFNATTASANAALGIGSGTGPSNFLGPCKPPPPPPAVAACPIAGITSPISREPFNQPGSNYFPYLAGVNVYGPDDGIAVYDGLQITLQKRTSHGLTFNANYTYSHALNTATGGNTPAPQDSADVRRSYGNEGYPFQHFALTTSYVVPTVKALWIAGEGWEINSAVNFLSASGVTISSAGDFAGDAGTSNWSQYFSPGGNINNFSSGGFGYLGLPGANCYTIPKSNMAATGCTLVGNGGNGSNYPQICINAAAAEPQSAAMNAIDPGISNGLVELGYNGGTTAMTASTGTLAGTTGASIGGQTQTAYGCWVSSNGLTALVAPALGTFGNLAKNTVQAAPFSEWDLSLIKNTKIRERLTAQFRAEFYNILNVPSFTGGSGTVTSSTFGRSTSTPNTGNVVNGTGGQREVQLGLKFIF
jgi:hypothetical protein